MVKIKEVQASQSGHSLILQQELSELAQATGRLYEAVEKGFLPMDSSLQERAQKLKARRESILIEMAGTRQQRTIPLDKINAGQIQVFGDALRTQAAGLAKQLLEALPALAGR